MRSNKYSQDKTKAKILQLATLTQVPYKICNRLLKIVAELIIHNIATTYRDKTLDTKNVPIYIPHIGVIELRVRGKSIVPETIALDPNFKKDLLEACYEGESSLVTHLEESVSEDLVETYKGLF